MPAIRNYLSVVGDVQEVERFQEAAWGRMPLNPSSIGLLPPEQSLCFHSLVPLPSEYSTVPYKDGSENSGNNMEIKTWGVEWGALNLDIPIRAFPNVLTYKFDTAWNPPIVFLNKAAQKWPKLRFFLSWGGEGPELERMLFDNEKATQIIKDINMVEVLFPYREVMDRWINV
ncbi:MAG: hypothetical protein KGL39_00255 [Patescibacteria group bacterium]|nr:hypothetical protein [Patescibacteria group bacterium]